MVTKEIITQSISNGTLNPKMLDQFMRDMKIRAFTYDYNIQRDLVNYHEFRFTINPLKWEFINAWNPKKERCYPVTLKDYQMFSAGTKDKYIRSDIYNKYLSSEQVTANMKYFRNSLLVYVDGKIYNDYRVKVSVDNVEILFRYKDLNCLAHLDDDPNVKLDGIVTDIRILLLPNAINTVADELDASQFSGNMLYSNRFPSSAVSKLKASYSYFGFWINKTNQHHFFIPYITWNEEYKYFMLPDAPPTDVTKYSIMIIGMDLIFKTIDLDPTQEWFELNSDKMPLPKDDIAIFVKSADFDMYVPNDLSVSLKEYYPNIYHVNNPKGYTLRMVAFYDMKPHNDHIYFDNEIQPYLRFFNLKRMYETESIDPTTYIDTIYETELQNSINNRHYELIDTQTDTIEVTDTNVDYRESDIPLNNTVVFVNEMNETYLVNQITHSSIELADTSFTSGPDLDNTELVYYREGAKVPEILREYKPINWKYSFQDMFEGTPYKDVNFNNLWDGFLYKMNTIESILKRWMLFYEEYQRRTYGFLPGWYHRMSSYPNLNKKVRTSTLPEIPESDGFVNFNQPQYIFSYKNTDISGDVKSFNWFIDGKFTIPTYTAIYHGYQYVYFPTSKINPDSVIEVERFDGVKFSHTFKLIGPETYSADGSDTSVKYAQGEDAIGDTLLRNGNTLIDPVDTMLSIYNPNDTIEIPVSKLTKHPIIVNSLFFVDSNGNYLNRSSENPDFELTVVDAELGDVKVDPLISVFNLLPEQTLRITAVNPDMIGKEIQLKCRNQVIKFKSRESGIDWEYGYEDLINLNEKKSILHVKPDIGLRLRVYDMDGRLIPKISYRVYNVHNFQDVPKFNIPMRPRDEMQFMVNYVGYDERLVFHREYTYPNGYVDLRGRLTRPFSLAYHDVYLDGYRLTKYDIDQISPHSFVITAAKRLGTINCVEIYEKCHQIDEYVKFEFDEESKYIMDELVETGALGEAIDINYPKVETSESLKHVDDIVDSWYDLIRNYLVFKYINGDKRYDYGRWSHIFNINGGRTLLNADDRVRYVRNIRSMFYFNHDWTIEGKVSPEPVHDYDSLQYPYDPSIEVNEKDYQEKSYYVDKYNPVFDEAFDIIPDPGLEPTQDKIGASEEERKYIPDGDFHHVDGVDREILTPEELEWLRKNSQYNPWQLDLDMVVEFEDGTTIDMVDDGTGPTHLEDKIALVIPAEEYDMVMTDLVLVDKNYATMEDPGIHPEDIRIDGEYHSIDASDVCLAISDEDVEPDETDLDAAGEIVEQTDESISIDYAQNSIPRFVVEDDDIEIIGRVDAHEMYLSMLDTEYEDYSNWDQLKVERNDGRLISVHYDVECAHDGVPIDNHDIDTVYP